VAANFIRLKDVQEFARVAQTSSVLGSGAIRSSADFIKGIRSRPASATHPVGTDDPRRL